MPWVRRQMRMDANGGKVTFLEVIAMEPSVTIEPREHLHGGAATGALTMLTPEVACHAPAEDAKPRRQIRISLAPVQGADFTGSNWATPPLKPAVEG